MQWILCYFKSVSWNQTFAIHGKAKSIRQEDQANRCIYFIKGTLVSPSKYNISSDWYLIKLLDKSTLGQYRCRIYYWILLYNDQCSKRGMFLTNINHNMLSMYLTLFRKSKDGSILPLLHRILIYQSITNLQSITNSFLL